MHLYLPRAAFDEVRTEAEWIFLRRGAGYAALWLPGGYTPTTEGFWADTEILLSGSRCAVLSFVGNAARNGAFREFIGHARELQPQWDEASLALSVVPPGEEERLSVSYEAGAIQGGKPIDTRGARFETPWGTMALGTGELQLQTPVGSYRLDLGDLLDG